jgi:hypothetical protein
MGMRRRPNGRPGAVWDFALQGTASFERPVARCLPPHRVSRGATPRDVGDRRANRAASVAPTRHTGGTGRLADTTANRRPTPDDTPTPDDRSRDGDCRTPAIPSPVAADHRVRIGRAGRSDRADRPFRSAPAGPRSAIFRPSKGSRRRGRTPAQPLPVGDLT